MENIGIFLQKHTAQYSFVFTKMCNILLGQQNSSRWVHLLIYCTLIVASDMARTEPAAGLTVNSTGRAWRSLAALPCQLFVDMSDTCLEQVTLGDPNPSPGTRRAKLIGT